MTFEEFKQYLNENKDNSDVQSVLDEFKTVSQEDVRSYLETDEGKRLLQPKLDSYHAKSLESWKANNLDPLIEEEVNKRNPQETEDQKRIRKLEEEIQNRDKAAKRQALETKALRLAQEKQLPSDLVNYFIGEDEETTASNLDKLKEKLDESVKSQVEARFKENGRTVEEGDGRKASGESISDIIEQANIRNK